MTLGKSYCDVLCNIVNHSVVQNAVLAGWRVCCVIVHKKKIFNVGIMVRGFAFLSSDGLHTEVAME